jgi:HD-like signal output (HDOD) protein
MNGVRDERAPRLASVQGDRAMRATCPLCDADGAVLAPVTARLQLLSCHKCREAYLVKANNGTLSAGAVDSPAPLATRIAQGSVMQGVFEALDESIRNLPTIPTATQRVIGALHDPLTNTEDLVRLINEDATLSVRILKLANSTTFAGRQKITDLRLACARLGMRNIANVAHVVAQAHLYRSRNPVFQELMDASWQHAVATARLAEAFAGAVTGGPQLGLFLMGLVHDIGKPVLLDAITNQYKGRLGRLKDSPDLLLTALDDFSPYAGLRVAQYWNLSIEVRFSTFYAALPSAAPAMFRRQAYLIALSSAAAECAGYGKVRTSRDPQAEAAALGKELSEEFGGDAVHDAIESVDEEIRSHLAVD